MHTHINLYTYYMYNVCVCVCVYPWFCFSAAAAAMLLQLCPTLCDPRDGSLPGSPVPGILQARTLEWVAISFSNTWKWKVKVKSLSHVWLLATPWTAAYQAPPSMGFARQEYWSELPLPSMFLWRTVTSDPGSFCLERISSNPKCLKKIVHYHIHGSNLKYYLKN